MPLRTGGVLENERLRGKVSIGFNASGLAGTFEPTGLAPQKVVDVDGVGDATRDTYQRKCLNDGTNFFVIYWESDDKQVKYVASADGLTWTSPTVLWTFSVAPYYGGNIDIQYPNRGSKDLNGDAIDLAMHFTGSNGGTSGWRAFVKTGQTLTEKGSAALAGLIQAQGGSVIANLNAVNDYCIYHEKTPNRIGLQRSPANLDDTDTSVSHGGTTTGGNQLLQYKTSSPYRMLALAKGGDNKLYYNIVNEPVATFVNDAFTEIATLGTSFSDFCACSEALAAGDPERVHIVYIKSSGELCYRKYANDALGSERVLVSSGASYPVIASGINGKLYVFYVMDGKIWVLHFNGISWLSAVELFTDEHTYNNPAYLSSNQNVQSGKICLTWTEGTGSPYEVWFSYLED